MKDEKRQYVETAHGDKAHILDPKAKLSRRTMCGLGVDSSDKVVGISERKLCGTCSIVLRRRAFAKKTKPAAKAKKAPKKKAAPKLPPPTFQQRWDEVQRKIGGLLRSKAMHAKKQEAMRILQNEQSTLLDEAVAAAKKRDANTLHLDLMKPYQIRIGRIEFGARIDPTRRQVVMHPDDLQLLTNEVGRLLREADERGRAQQPRSRVINTSTLNVEGYRAEVVERDGVASMASEAYHALQDKLQQMVGELGRLRRITDKLLGE